MIEPQTYNPRYILLSRHLNIYVCCQALVNNKVYTKRQSICSCIVYNLAKTFTWWKQSNNLSYADNGVANTTSTLVGLEEQPNGICWYHFHLHISHKSMIKLMSQLCGELQLILCLSRRDKNHPKTTWALMDVW